MNSNTSSALIWQDGRWLNGPWHTDDRALHYGDGLFETLRLHQGHAPLWTWHRQRLEQGLAALSFPGNSIDFIERALAQLPEHARLSAGKLLVSRGRAPRGYLAPECPQLELLWQPFNAPSWAHQQFPNGYCTDINPIRLAIQPRLAGIKHLNRLEQVLARQQWQEGCQEMLLLDYDDWVVEGCMSNLFLWENNQLVTPQLDRCGVDGVIRRWLMSQHKVVEARIDRNRLQDADAVFFCNALIGIIAAERCGARQYDPSISRTVCQPLQQQLESLFC